MFDCLMDSDQWIDWITELTNWLPKIKWLMKWVNRWMSNWLYGKLSDSLSKGQIDWAIDI